jgi:hypothetical protein
VVPLPHHFVEWDGSRVVGQWETGVRLSLGSVRAGYGVSCSCLLLIAIAFGAAFWAIAFGAVLQAIAKTALVGAIASSKALTQQEQIARQYRKQLLTKSYPLKK